MRYFQKIKGQIKKRDYKITQMSPESEDKEPEALSTSLKNNLDAVMAEFSKSCDVVLREFSFGKDGEERAAIVFIDGLSNLPLINENILKPMMYDSRIFSEDKQQNLLNIGILKDRLLTVGDAKSIGTITEAVMACIEGDAVLLVEGLNEAIDISAKGWDKRAVTEPATETVLRGPREGFTENLRTNTAMIRRKIKNPSLKILPVTIGERTNTNINIVYVEGLANPELIEELKKRLGKIDTDEILAAGYIEQYIEDAPFSIFQTVWYSEKPDTIAGKLLEGRVAVFIDGTPFVLTVPMLFMENFQTSEDYAIRTYYASALRILRLASFFIALFAPAIYVALSTFHQELIPTSLLISMAASSEGVPFPASVETGIMMFAFEILREAGVRMPRPIGQAISIVGALVMGEASVRAGLVGAPIVIVIAITAISSFVIPLASDALALLRWLLLILASTMGNYGLTLGGLMILIHLASLKSFSTSYLAPFAPFQKRDLKDSAVRAPLWAMRTRPRSIKPEDIKRQNMPFPFNTAVKHKD